MKQVLVKSGQARVEEVPAPTVAPGMVLVRVRRSVISSGTESAFLSEGGTLSYLMKKARDPQNIEKAKRKLANVGFKGTFEVVRSKLFEDQAPGYSTAGVVTGVGEGVYGLHEGDAVACAGLGYASHAEYNLVPHQLATPVPEGVSFDQAAFVTLGAIAMQGVRRTEPTFGETFVVLGLGLIGQLAAQILRAAGCRVVGCDPEAKRRKLGAELGANAVCAPDALAATVAEHTAGYGADGVLICAATQDSAVTNQALDVCRVKGRTVVVGAVGLSLEREPLYMKELDFGLSCSYGPGRYQPAYEEKGLDYPLAYVRWTEGRNMAEFLRMLAEGKVDTAPLVSVSRPVTEVREAYDAVINNGTETIAAVLTYEAHREPEAGPPAVFPLRAEQATAEVGVAVVGAGSFATAYHLPNLQQIDGCSLEAVVARSGRTARAAGERFGARYCSTDYNEVLKDPRVHAVIVATRHNLHREIAKAACRAGKHVFVEKPLALTVPECEEICAAVESAGVLLTVGFNRRFSAYAQEAKAALHRMQGSKMIVYRCNAGVLPAGHWTTDPVEGGGRILGEAVHFFDFCSWLLDAGPVAVKAESARPRAEAVAPDNLSVLLRFPDGSLATVIYTTTGAPGVPKERIEIFGGGGAIVIDDFKSVAVHGMPGRDRRSRREDKGQRALLENFIHALQGKAALDVTAAHGLRATRIAVEALQQVQQAPEPAFPEDRKQ